MTRRDRVRAWLADRMTARFDRRFGAAMRARQLSDAHGRVLEIGAGTGPNLPHYPAAVGELVVTEPREAMLDRARRRAAAAARPATLLRAPAEDLPFPDGAFDTVVCTVVLCTVPDQAAALREVRRVLRPGGVLLFAEHVRSPDPRRARWQDRMERPWRVIADGCHPNRDTLAALDAAGFRVEVVERGELPMVPRL
ncbi:MAG: class I SAM-dependent methyltransferase, partial [Actinomycetota bacterium]